MAALLSLTEAQIFTAVRTFLIGILPGGIEVIKAEINRVPEPAAPDFVVMTPILVERLSTNIDVWSDGYPSAPGLLSTVADMQRTIQIDVHGPNSPDNVQIIQTLFRSQYAVNAFLNSGLPIAPLYSGEPHQSPFSNSEQQEEFMWTIDLVLQVNPIVTVSQDFADQLLVTPVVVETIA